MADVDGVVHHHATSIRMHLSSFKVMEKSVTHHREEHQELKKKVFQSTRTYPKTIKLSDDSRTNDIHIYGLL